MARAKKTAAVTTTVTSTAPKTRGIDLQEVEARVTALDKAKRRSYDIFDIEQRVYNLEKNSGGGGGTSEIVVLQEALADVSKLDYTITSSTHSGSYAPEYAFGKFASTSLMWIANAAESWLDIASSDQFTLRCIKWLSNDPNRYSAPVKVSYSDNGTDYTDATIMEASSNMCFVGDNVKAKHWRLHFNTTNSPTYYAGMNDAVMYGYK